MKSIDSIDSVQRTVFSVAEGCVCSTQNNQDEREKWASIPHFILILGVLIFMTCTTCMTLIIERHALLIMF